MKRAVATCLCCPTKNTHHSVDEKSCGYKRKRDHKHVTLAILILTASVKGGASHGPQLNDGMDCNFEALSVDKQETLSTN